MGEFRVHHVRFFEYKPKAIHCLAYDKTQKRLAVSRSDGSLEIWSETDNWFQEKVIPGSGDRSVESVLWQGSRLFSAGLDGEITEYDLVKLQPKHSAFSHAGPIWCLAQNVSGTRIAAGTEEGCVVLFDTEGTSLQYEKAFDKQEGRILSVAWQEGENVIVTGSVDNIRLWSATSGHAFQRLTIGRDEAKKETIVWCVAVTSDLTVISGDSRGKTCFWNGKMGTLLKSFQSHEADVLSLCINQAEDMVLTVGVEPTIVQFDRVCKSGTDSHSIGRWTRSMVRKNHTHDIRAIVFAGKTVVSGGVDTNLVFHMMRDSSSNWKYSKRPAIPQRSLVHIANDAGLLLLQYPTWIEVWRLGSTRKSSGKNSEILPLDSKPLKLVQLKAKIGEVVVCSAISSDGSLLAYSDERNIRLYRLCVGDLDAIQPEVALTRIKIVDEEIEATHQMTFTPDNKLITASCTAAIQVIKVTDADVKLEHIFPPLKDVSSIHLLAVSQSGDLVAVADHKKRVRVYNIETKQGAAPQCDVRDISKKFSDRLASMGGNRTVFEYNVSKSEMTSWSRVNSHFLPKQWTNKSLVPSRVTVNPQNQDQYFIHDEETFMILDKTKPMRPGNQKGGSADGSAKACSFCCKYKYLLHLEPVNDDWLVAVERTPVAINESLPATLKQKKFGT